MKNNKFIGDSINNHINININHNRKVRVLASDIKIYEKKWNFMVYIIYYKNRIYKILIYTCLHHFLQANKKFWSNAIDPTIGLPASSFLLRICGSSLHLWLVKPLYSMKITKSLSGNIPDNILV